MARRKQQIVNRQNFRTVTAEDYYIIKTILGIRLGGASELPDGSYEIQLDVKNRNWNDFEERVRKHRSRGRINAS